jgi:hypothetical protein
MELDWNLGELSNMEYGEIRKGLQPSPKINLDFIRDDAPDENCNCE